MARGTLRIYLGAAPGVGKTYRMLGEGMRRRSRGTDVVIGVVETHGRAETAAQLVDLEVVPRREVAYRGTTLMEMDVDAILRRNPKVVLVDEYAHTNAPGSRNEKRWQDVEQILDAGIDVISTLNIQHLESLNDVISQITGIVQRETVPDEIVRRADQLELVDMTPEAIRRRLAHGNIYPAERIDAAMANYFRAGNLGALRELALLWVADRVEESLNVYLDQHGISQTWETRERVIVGITGRAGGEALIRRASRMAGRVGGALIGVHVLLDDGLAHDDSETLAAQRKLVAELGGTAHEVVGHDPAEAIVAFARREKGTQLVLGASKRSRAQELLRGSFVARVTRLAGDIDVHVIAYEHEPSHRVRRRTTEHPIDPRRTIAAWLLVVLGLPTLIAATLPLREHIAISTELLLMLASVLAIAALGGRIVAACAAVAGSLLVNWFFVPPYHTFTIAEVENLVALLVFVGVALTVASLVVVASRRATDSIRARSEAEALARATASLTAEPEPLPGLLDQLRTTFALTGVRMSGSSPDGPFEVTAGETAAEADATVPVPVPGDVTATACLELFGRQLSNDDLRLVRVLADQLGLALEKGRLAADAAEAEKLADVDAVRTALLRAVSHDLRTPLASIKAMVSGLRDPSVTFDTDQVAEALVTIEEETDRLNRLVGNLLDASRLQIGALAVDIRPSSVGAIIVSALQSVNAPHGAVAVELSDDDRAVLCDATLLERSLANVVSNALRHSRSDCPVRVEAGVVGASMHVRVVDRGPGVPMAERSKIVQPFQQMGDQRSVDGVGLGLSIAKGFVDAMHGTFTLDDTPGGGLTVTMVLPLAQEVPT
jgi:two-component system sensor histidine kinase KdpD